jgi:hypothetical protein
MRPLVEKGGRVFPTKTVGTHKTRKTCHYKGRVGAPVVAKMLATRAGRFQDRATWLSRLD